MDSSKKHDNPNPRLRATVFSKLFFWWLKPLFAYGRRHELEIKDIYNVLPNDVSEYLGDKLERNWLNEVRTAKIRKRKAKLSRSLRQTFFWAFAYYGGWTLFLCTVLRVFQPYVLGLLIWYFDPRAASTPFEAYGYASGVVIMAALIALISHHSYLGLMGIGMRMRIACSSLIYRKILRLSKGSNDTTPGQIVNLLSNDVQRFDQLFILLHYIWIMPIQGALIAFLVWESVGIASLAGIFLITIQTIPVQGYMGKWASYLRLKTAVRTDERVRLMSEIISGIHVIKMYTWERPFQELVGLARRLEIDVLTVTSYLRGFTLATFVFTERTTLYFTLMTYVLLGHVISADKVFSMAQYFNILQATMAIYYPIAVTSAAEAAVSVKRVEDFLLLDEIVVPVAPADRPSAPATHDKSSSVVIKDVTASWTNDTIVNTLHRIDISIESGKLYALVGPVGAGKSSFLQLILRELQPLRGYVLRNGTISYASQESWLFTGTVRDNILFGQPYERDRYHRVIGACALSKDFEQLPDADNTLLGDRGAGLSGGQRARINLARAVYRDSNIYLLDDPLSAVDAHVSKYLFDECINGYLRHKTRILVTHQTQYLKNCDYIVVLNNGQIAKRGTYEELKGEGGIDILDADVSRLEEINEDLRDNESEEGGDASSRTDGNDLQRVSSRVENMGNGDGEKNENQLDEEREELMAKGGSRSKTAYWRYLRAGGSLTMLVCFLVCTIAGQFGSSGSDYWVAHWTKEEELRAAYLARKDAPSGNNDSSFPIGVNRRSNSSEDSGGFGESDYVDRDRALWIYGSLITLSIVMTTSRNLIFYKICMNASRNLHNLMFSSILRAPIKFFDSHASGRILNRFSKDVGAIDEILPRTMIESIQIFAVMTGILIQVIIINWWTIFPICIMGYLYWEIRNIYLATARKMKHLEAVGSYS